MMKYRMTKTSILDLPVSVHSWILLTHALDQYWDIDIFRKMITEYYTEIPLLDMCWLYEKAHQKTDDSTFDKLLELLFGLNNDHARHQAKRGDWEKS